MSPLRTTLLYALALVALPLLSGCMGAGLYRTARTLEPGEGDLAFTVSATNIAQQSASKGVNSVSVDPNITLPNLMPEIGYHLGIVDNFELGGRVALGSMMLELDAKYRFLGERSSPLQLAVQPALGYRTFILIDGPSAQLPLIATWQPTSSVGVSLAPYVGYWDLSVNGNDAPDLALGSSVTYGASVGVQLSGETMYFTPAVDVSQANMTVAGVDVSQTFINFGVTLGFVSGRELKALHRNEDRLDKMDEKLDRLIDEKEGAAPAPTPEDDALPSET